MTPHSEPGLTPEIESVSIGGSVPLARTDDHIRVAIVYGDYPPKPEGKADGGADFLAHLADELAASGVDVTVIVSRREDRTAPFTSPEGVRVLPIIEDWSFRGAMSGQFSKLRVALTEAAVDVVHLIYPDPYLRYGADSYHLPFLLKAAGAHRLVVTFFGFGVTGSSLTTKAGLLALFATSDRIVITDADLLAVFRRAFPFWRSKARSGLVGSIAGADAATWSSSELHTRRRMLGLDPVAHYVGFFGFWTPDKGLEDLIGAVKGLVDSGDPVTLLLVGGREREERTEYERSIVTRIADLGLKESVIDTGPLSVDEVDRYLLALDACVLPFRVNPLGRSSLALALTLGLPTIVTRPAAGADLIQFLPQFERGDTDGLMETIRTLIWQESARESAAAAARRISSNWNWRTISQHYLATYAELRRRES